MLLLKFLLSLFLISQPAPEATPLADSTQESTIVDCTALVIDVVNETGTINPTFTQAAQYAIHNPAKLKQAQECGYFDVIEAEPEATPVPTAKTVRDIVPVPFCFGQCGPTPTAELEKHISIWED